MSGATAGALLREAAWWRLVSLLLERPRAGWWPEVAALAREIDDAELRRAAVAAEGASEGDWLTALGPGGVASGREVGHDRRTDPGRLLAELEAHYAAFAFTPSGAEPPDHVAVEAGFVGYLRLKEAFARSAGLADAAETTAATCERFLAEHVASWAAPLATALDDTRLEYLRLAASAAARRAGPPRRSAGPEPPLSPECAMTCGVES